MPVETAPAKINLTLEVLGKRADGYHELCSLVAFALDAADRIEILPDSETRLTVSGPFGVAIEGENIVQRAMKAVAEHGISFGGVVLDKQLPVASGIGGGSANAAALLRAVRRTSWHKTSSLPWPAIAAKLGSDVTPCYVCAPLYIVGAGDTVVPLDGFPLLYAVLINPLEPVPPDKTRQVFRTMDLPSGRLRTPKPLPRRFSRVEEVLDYIESRDNELTPAARQIVPAIDDVLDTLSSTPGCRLARLSGAGPTCFGLFDTLEAAEKAATRLQRAHPSWWVRATRIG